MTSPTEDQIVERAKELWDRHPDENWIPWEEASAKERHYHFHLAKEKLEDEEEKSGG